jgi:hypothetical protein
MAALWQQADPGHAWSVWRHYGSLRRVYSGYQANSFSSNLEAQHQDPSSWQSQGDHRCIRRDKAIVRWYFIIYLNMLCSPK